MSCRPRLFTCQFGPVDLIERENHALSGGVLDQALCDMGWNRLPFLVKGHVPLRDANPARKRCLGHSQFLSDAVDGVHATNNSGTSDRSQ